MNEEKNKLYQLILRQLMKDGYTRAAAFLSDTALLPMEPMQTVQGDEPDLEAIVQHHYLTHIPVVRQQKGGQGVELVTKKKEREREKKEEKKVNDFHRCRDRRPWTLTTRLEYASQ